MALPLVLAAVTVPGPWTADAAAAAAVVEDEYPRQTLRTGGGDLSLVEARGQVATVLVCMSVECPISNEFLPTIARIADTYRKQGVHFVGLDPNAGETLDAMAEYARRQKLSFPFAKDEDARISRRLGFSVTPEVRVFNASGKMVYRGRIDDRYRAGGGQPGAKISPDLERALDEVIAGKPVSQARTKPVGCPIQLAAPPGE